MKKLTSLSFDSILLFILVVPYIMTYGLLPGETPYWLFGLIFASLALYVLLDVIDLKEILYNRSKSILLLLTIILVLGSSFASSIVSRHLVAPIYGVHDIILQQESAIRYFLDGKNPYSETYFGTPLENWHYSETEINPALYHYVMQPLYHIFPLPFYYISNRTIGYFDGRIPLFFLFFVSLFIAYKIPKEQLEKRLFVILLAFNPAMLGYTLEGRSDMFMYGFFITSLYFLYKKRLLLASILLALSFAVKQSIWPILPFYIAYLWFRQENRKYFAMNFLVFGVVFLALVLPFLFWNSKAFLDSTVFYLSGQTEHAYPVSGYGVGMLLSQFGFIKDRHDYYPFVIWQIVICVPLLLGLVYYLKKNDTVKRMVFVYGIFLFVYWYLSRYFNNSHLGFLSVIFLTAYFWPESSEDQSKKLSSKSS